MDPALRALETIPPDFALDHRLLGVSLPLALLTLFRCQGALQFEEVRLAPTPERQRLLLSKHDSSLAIRSLRVGGLQGFHQLPKRARKDHLCAEDRQDS